MGWNEVGEWIGGSSHWMQKTTQDGLVDKIVFFFFFYGYGNVCVVCCKLFELDVLWCVFTLQKSRIVNVINQSKANFSNN
jgi:hypothetical protein